MFQTSSDPSSSSSKHSKSKSKQHKKKWVNSSSTFSLSKQPNISSDNPSSSSIKPPLSSSEPSQSSVKLVSSHVRNEFMKKNLVWIKKASSKPSPSPSSSKPTSESSKTLPFSSSEVPPNPIPTQFEAPPIVTRQQAKTNNSYAEESSYEPALSFLNPPASPSSSTSSDGLPLSPSGSSPSSPKLRPTLKQIQSSDRKEKQKKPTYSLSEKDSLPIYKIPKRIKILIKKDIVPKVLNRPLSPSSYSDYFATLMYAEELYLQKWSGFQMCNVELEFQDATIHTWWKKKKKKKKNDKILVVFEIDSVPERRPFFLSRDIVYARPSGRTVEPFEGVVCRVAKSTYVLVDFEDDFHFQHRSGRRYDINFSLNRICFRRAHQAIRATSSLSFPKSSFLFPDFLSGKSILTKKDMPSNSGNTLDQDQITAVDEILSVQSPPPYLVEGQLCVKLSRIKQKALSKTGEVVREAVFQIYHSSPRHQILICSPSNGTCDELMISLQKVIPESDIFRVNAAFREVYVVPTDILPSCPYDGECFTCPSLHELKEFRVILSTFVSCFRLHKEGLGAGHFSHVFIVDASAGTEPETMIALANFADENTAVIITGSPGNTPYLVRSGMARRKGLAISYFERLNNQFSSDEIA